MAKASNAKQASTGTRGKRAAKSAKPAARKRKTGTGTARRKTAARAAASRKTKRQGPKRPPSTLASAATAVRGAVAAAVSSVAERLPGSSKQPDAIALLETDHRRLQALLDQGTQTTARGVKSRTEILRTLTKALNVHELIEEKLLYPALEPHREARDIVLEGFEEHHVADLLLKELHKLAKDNDQWGAKFKVLQESIEHHIQEEEGKMFRSARAVLSRDELQALGGRMAALKARQERG